MAEEIKDVNAKIDEAEAAMKKYASKDTVISIGGYEFTPAKLMIAFTIVSSTLGGLYGTFEVYKDYIGMKKKIASYEAPDLSGFDKRLAVIEENSQKTSDYTRDIKVDLKNDLRRNESEMREMRKAVREDLEKARNEANTIRREMADARREIEREVVQLKKEVDSKIQKAIDNPLANNK